MKRRCFPVKGDHNLLTPDAQTLSGVSLRPQVHSEGVASLSGHLSDSSSSKLATALTRRRLSASPTRRLRFEDETEMEAESRYLERQRRTGVLMSKPHLNLYVNGTAGAVLREAGHVADGQHRSGHSDICRTGGGVNLDLHLHPSVFDCSGRSFNRHGLNLRTEPIRETYIGSVTSAERGRAGCVSHMQVRRRVNQVELHEPQVILPQATPSTDLPRNPYEPHRVEAPTQPSVIGTATVKSHSPISWPPQHNYMRSEMNQNQKEQGRATATKSHREHQSGPQVKEQQPFVEVGNPNTSSDTTAESQAPPKSCSAEGQPVGTELYSDDTSCPAHFSCRDEPSRLSLRRLFSSVRLSRTRTASLDRLSSRPHPSTSDPAPPGSRTSSGLLKKSPSAQLLSEGSPVLQLKKSLSAQNFAPDQNKKTDRSSDYTPTATQFLPRSLSVEDVGRPCSVRSVGRVLQVCSDGTVLLELHRPSGRTFGFIISRGRGRADSGVYVEDMADSAVEKLLAGLLAVGDEIVEVDGERVSSLSLDEVTQLLSQNSSTTLRVLRHQGTSPR